MGEREEERLRSMESIFWQRAAPIYIALGWDIVLFLVGAHLISIRAILFQLKPMGPKGERRGGFSAKITTAVPGS